MENHGPYIATFICSIIMPT
uniref:Uncharacterized protein n=1 Tax=Arundo donax TaxID=35708 RepID=A0A0A9C3U6_ARUDO